jgi:hypothetical protein
MKNGKEIRKSMETDTRQLAKAELRKIEDVLDAGVDSPLPSNECISSITNTMVAESADAWR